MVKLSGINHMDRAVVGNGSFDPPPMVSDMAECGLPSNTVSALVATGMPQREAVLTAMGLVSASMTPRAIAGDLVGMALPPALQVEAAILILKGAPRGGLEDAVAAVKTCGISLDWVAAVAREPRFRALAEDKALSDAIRGTLSSNLKRVEAAYADLANMSDPAALAAMVSGVTAGLDAGTKNMMAQAILRRPERAAMDAFLGVLGQGPWTFPDGVASDAIRRHDCCLSDLVAMAAHASFRRAAVAAMGHRRDDAAREALVDLACAWSADERVPASDANMPAYALECSYQGDATLAAYRDNPTSFLQDMPKAWAFRLAGITNDCARSVGIRALAGHLDDPDAVDVLWGYATDRVISEEASPFREYDPKALALRGLGRAADETTFRRTLGVIQDLMDLGHRLDKEAETRGASSEQLDWHAVYTGARKAYAYAEAGIRSFAEPGGHASTSTEALVFLQRLVHEFDGAVQPEAIAHALIVRGEPEAFKVFQHVLHDMRNVKGRDLNLGPACRLFLDRNPLSHDPAYLAEMIRLTGHHRGGIFDRLTKDGSAGALKVAIQLVTIFPDRDGADAKGVGYVGWPNLDGWQAPQRQAIVSAMVANEWDRIIRYQPSVAMNYDVRQKAEPERNAGWARLGAAMKQALASGDTQPIMEVCLTIGEAVWGPNKIRPDKDAMRHVAAILGTNEQGRNFLRESVDHLDTQEGVDLLGPIVLALTSLPDRAFAIGLGTKMAEKAGARDIPYLSRVMAELGVPLEWDAHMAALGSPDPKVRVAACERTPSVADHFGVSNLTYKLERMLYDPEWSVAEAAFRALRTIRGQATR